MDDNMDEVAPESTIEQTDDNSPKRSKRWKVVVGAIIALAVMGLISTQTNTTQSDTGQSVKSSVSNTTPKKPYVPEKQARRAYRNFTISLSKRPMQTKTPIRSKATTHML